MLSFKSKGSLGKTTVFVLFLAFSLGLTHSPAWASGKILKILERIEKGEKINGKQVQEVVNGVEKILRKPNVSASEKNIVEKFSTVFKNYEALSTQYAKTVEKADQLISAGASAVKVSESALAGLDQVAFKTGDKYTYIDKVIEKYTPGSHFLSYEELTSEISRLKASDINNPNVQGKVEFLEAVNENVFQVLKDVGGVEDSHIVMQFADLKKGGSGAEGAIENMVEVKFFKKNQPIEPIGVGTIELRSGKLPGVASKDTWLARIEKSEKNNPAIDCFKKGSKAVK